MTAIRPDEAFVGLVALALMPLIAWRIIRGLRTGRMNLYRGDHVSREERPGRFNLALAFHLLGLLAMAAISADLLLNLGLKDLP